MARLSLPNITLVMIETRCHELARMAVHDCLRHADFGEVLICSDNFNLLRIPGATHALVPDWQDKLGWCKFLWQDAPNLIKTPQTLIIQWDSWIVDPAKWDPAFEACDYIGAPWWYGDGLNVGNSGFSLRSKRLMDFLLKHKEIFPVTTSNEDDLLSRHYRRTLEQHNFRWASQGLAAEFSFERTLGKADCFGFHGIFNWPRVLSHEALMERLKIAAATPYVSTTTMFAELYASYPILKTGE